MLGAIVFVVLLVLVVPIGVMFGGALWSAGFGWSTGSDADRRAEGTPWALDSDA